MHLSIKKVSISNGHTNQISDGPIAFCHQTAGGVTDLKQKERLANWGGIMCAILTGCSLTAVIPIIEKASLAP